MFETQILQESGTVENYRTREDLDSRHSKFTAAKGQPT